jgi:hypothetical protein
VAQHYAIPAVSFLDWLRKSGGLDAPQQRALLLADGLTHPTAAGHRLAAALLQQLFARALNATAVAQPSVLEAAAAARATGATVMEVQARSRMAETAEAVAPASARELVTLPPFIEPAGASLPDDPNPLCVELFADQADWTLASDSGFDWVTGGAHPAGLVAHAAGDRLELKVVTTQPHVELSLGLYKSWRCSGKTTTTTTTTDAAGAEAHDGSSAAACPGDVSIRLDNRPAALARLWTSFQFSVHVPVPVGVAASAGEHRVTLEVCEEQGAPWRGRVRECSG